VCPVRAPRAMHAAQNSRRLRGNTVATVPGSRGAQFLRLPFLIANPRLEIRVTQTKQTTAIGSNSEFSRVFLSHQRVDYPSCATAFLIDRAYQLEIEVTPRRISKNTLSNRRWIAILQSHFRVRNFACAARRPSPNSTRTCVTFSVSIMPTIRIRSSSGPYDVDFAPGTISRIGKTLARMDARMGLRANRQSGVYVLSSPRVWRHWGSILTRGIRGWRDNHRILFDDSESAKRLETVEQIARDLLRAGADRQSVIVAVGGGVVGDVAGFVAATYLRGVRLVHVPTTLVAQVDSSIGGKTGVDLPEGKNLIGAFYPPQHVMADPQTLATLPHREYRSGLYEVIKYAVIADRELFIYLARKMPALLRRDAKALAWIIPRCIKIKARIVAKDEREGGLRQILNFGHTLGHALETVSGYRRFLHGEAVGCGMCAATFLALLNKKISLQEAARIVFLIQSVGPIPTIPELNLGQLKKVLAGDKKSRFGSVRWVLPRRIGKVDWGIDLPWKTVAKVAQALPAMMAEENFGIFGIARRRP